MGNTVKIEYDGRMMTSSPAQIIITDWEIAPALRTTKFEGEWLDKAKAEKDEETSSRFLKITEIYSDCFFVTERTVSNHDLKINGACKNRSSR